jgi:hypothetical protein
LSYPAPKVAQVSDLTDRQRAILTFEGHRWIHLGAKDSAVREMFGVSPWRYQQELHQLLDDPAALAHDPQLINRLRRLREQRQRRRAG